VRGAADRCPKPKPLRSSATGWGSGQASSTRSAGRTMTSVWATGRLVRDQNRDGNSSRSRVLLKT